MIEEVLEKKFPNPKMPLYYTNHYTLLIAVLLSARCRDATVNKVVPKLFKLASSPQEMLEIKEILPKILHPVGLGKKKAEYILELSERLIKNFNGKVPDNLKMLTSLPGVGRKTASVVMVEGFKKDALPVDVHIRRCATMWGLSKGNVEEDLKKLIKKNLWGKRHLQIIFFARQYCSKRLHITNNCPICSKIK